MELSCVHILKYNFKEYYELLQVSYLRMLIAGPVGQQLSSVVGKEYSIKNVINYQTIR